MSDETTAALRGPDPVAGGADCVNCPLAKEGKAERPVRGVGPEAPLMILVGEGPGQNEHRAGLPFVGASGELVNRALRETGTARPKLWVTNATMCLPPRGTDEKKKHAAAAACRPRLEAELAQFPGKPVLALGGVAAKALVGELTTLPITEIAGAHFETDLDGTGVRSIIPTVHPAAILRSAGDGDKGPEKTGSHVADLAFWSLKWDILKVRALATGRDIRLSMKLGEDIFIELEDNERARELVWDRLVTARETKKITIDYETYVDQVAGEDGVLYDRNNALQAFIAKIRLIGLASGNQACSVAWEVLDEVIIDEYRQVLADPEITKIFHNSAYDTAVSRNQHYGFVINGPIEDTLLGQHCAWPGAKKKLQHVVSQYYAVEPWKSEFRDSGDSLEDEAIYNAKDALGTHKAVGPTNFWVKKNLVDRVYDVDKVKAKFAADMHLAGYYVDPDVNAECHRRLKGVIDEANGAMISRYEEIKERVHARLAAEQAKTTRKNDHPDYGERIRTREAELAKLIEKGKFTFNPSNANHAVAFLKSCGVALWQTTKSGRTATGGDVLEKFAHHPEVDELIRLRSNEQLFETFVVRMFNWTQDSNGAWRPPHVQDDGRVHPLWSPTQISGRFGSKDPASSNWSEGEETHKDPRKRLPNIRRQLVAPMYRGIVAFDMAQLEARLIAVQSGDPFLCKVFRDGLDIHHEFGVFAFPRMATLDRKSEEYQKLRNLTKRLEYGAIYGGSDVTVHKSVAADEPALAGANGFAMVKAAVAKMKQAIGGVFAWQQRLLAETSIPPYTLRSYLLGRMRVFPLGNPPPTDIANNPNQFAGADIMDIGLCKLLPKLEKYAEPVLPILHQHDAIYFECAEGDMMAVARDINDSFTTSIDAVDGKPIDFMAEVKMGFAYNMEPSDKQKALHPQLVWDCGRPGLKQVKL